MIAAHAAAVSLVCLALAGSLAACASAPGAGQSDPPTPSPADGPLSSTPAAGPADAGVTPARSAAPTSLGADGIIVFDGDSLTEGFMLLPSQSYPAQAMRQLPPGIRWANVAVSGQTWPDLLADVTTEVDPLFSEKNDFNILVVWAGANDLAAGYTAQEIYENARTYCLARKQRGFTVLVCTMYPLQPKGDDQRYEALRVEYDRLLRDTWPQFADALVDLAADARIGDASPESRAGYFIDIVHLNETGYGVIADAVAAVLKPLVESRTGPR
jgi:lysophospholipase L1-like esterase